MNFYKRDLGDYAVDTRHLTLAEHGAYTLLLDFYYTTERSLPPNIIKLMAPKNKDEITAFKSVLRQFFFLRNGRHHHKRCIREIGQYHVKVEAYRLSGRKGGLNRQAIAKQSLRKNSRASLESKNKSKRVEEDPETAPRSIGFKRVSSLPTNTEQVALDPDYPRLKPEGE